MPNMQYVPFTLYFIMKDFSYKNCFIKVIKIPKLKYKLLSLVQLLWTTTTLNEVKEIFKITYTHPIIVQVCLHFSISTFYYRGGQA